MAYSSRPSSMLPPGSSAASALRQPSNYHAIPQQQSSALASRIEFKKSELENLKQLRDMSGALAMQMQALEKKLGTLKDGTEAVACVLANWDNVLRAISMASTKATNMKGPVEQSSAEPFENLLANPSIPSTLVRIPAEQQDKLCE